MAIKEENKKTKSSTVDTKSGSMAYNRLEMQISQTLHMAIELFDTLNYLLILDYYDDITLFENDDIPDTVSYYQMKTNDESISINTAISENWLEKLYAQLERPEWIVKELGLITNCPLKIVTNYKDKSGKSKKKKELYTSPRTPFTAFNNTTIEKIKNGGVFTSILNYSGQLAYNTPAHLKDGKMMYCLKPEEASPLVYGLSSLGGDRIWAIGSKSENPELAMEVINYLCTPEGYMVSQYGPKGETWDYDEEGNTYFTEFGKKCNQDKNGTKMENHEGTYHDGELQINNLTWALDADNPDSNGETYNSKYWKSELVEPETEIEKDWVDKTGCITIDDYMERGKYTVAPVSSYAKPEMDQELSTIWSQVTTAIKTGSWQAMYAKTDAEFDKIVDSMKKEAESYGYQQCLEWSKEEAAKRKACEDALASSSSSTGNDTTSDTASSGAE